MKETSKTLKVVRVLERTQLFNGVDPTALEKIANALTLHEAAAGDDIVVQGEAGDSLYIILRGKAQVSVTDDELGVAQPVAQLGSFESFGEMALLLDEPRSATVTAIDAVTSLVLDRGTFDKIVMRLPQVGIAIARNLARRLLETDKNMGYQFVDLGQVPFQPDIYQVVPPYVWERNQAVPVAMDGETVTVAMVRPNDPGPYEALRQAMPGLKIKGVACAEGDFNRYQEKVVRPGLGLDRKAQQNAPVEMKYKSRDIVFFEADSAGSTAGSRATGTNVSGEKVISAFNQILVDALNRGASDIHIEPLAEGLRTRLRVDGRLIQFRETMPSDFIAPMVSRIKITAGLDIAEKRRPQDGRVSFAVRDARFDIRVNTMPTKFGEKVVMRVLDPKSVLKSLDDIILSKSISAMVRNVLFKASGCILVVGPTGSGKTTTLYSSLNELMKESSELNICTVEDPIEYSLDGVIQSQVNPSAGTKFSDILRALLRQDPDVIMIGEIRDAETAQIALEGALTGHMVLSTLHAEGAVEATTRLIDMGCPPFLVANAVDLVLAQRLLRRICQTCARPHTYSEAVLSNLKRVGLPLPSEKVPFKKGKGCPKCSNTGFAGRVGAYEVMKLTDEMREAIGNEEGEQVIRRLANEGRSMASFKQYSAYLLRSGATSPSEVLRFFGNN